MRIPDAYFDGGFGQRIPKLQAGAMPDRYGTEQVARSLNNLGGTLLNIQMDAVEEQGRQEYAAALERKQERERLEHDEAKSLAMTTLVSHETALTEVMDEIQRDTSIPTKDYQRVFTSEAEKVKMSLLRLVPQEYQWGFAPMFDEKIAKAKFALGDVQAREFKEQTKANLLLFLQGLERSPRPRNEKLAILDDALANDATWRAAGYGHDDLVTIRQNFAEKTAETVVAQLLTAGKPKEVMEALHKRDKDGSFTYLPEMDPKTRESYFTVAREKYERQLREQAEARREAERAQRAAAADAYTVYKEGHEALYNFSPKDEARLLRAMAGTEYAILARNLRSKTNSLGYVFDKIKEEPLKYGAAQLGINVPPLDLSKPAAWPAQLQARIKVGALIKQKYGLQNTPVLFNHEIQGLIGVMNLQSPAGLVSTFEQMGAATGMDKSVIRGIASQIAAQDPNLGMVIGLATEGQGHGAQLVAKGNKLIQAKAVTFGKTQNDEIATRFNSVLGEALTRLPQSRAMLLESTKAAYVALATERGLIPGKDNVDKKLFDLALKRLGVATTKVNSRRVIIPPGMNEHDFLSAFKGLNGETVKLSGGVRGFKNHEDAAEAILDDGRLVDAGVGLYRVEIDGKYLTRADGGDFLLSADVMGSTTTASLGILGRIINTLTPTAPTPQPKAATVVTGQALKPAAKGSSFWEEMRAEHETAEKESFRKDYEKLGSDEYVTVTQGGKVFRVPKRRTTLNAAGNIILKSK